MTLKQLLATALLCLVAATHCASAKNLLTGTQFSDENGWSIYTSEAAGEAGGSIAMDDGNLVITTTELETSPEELRAQVPIMLQLDSDYVLSFKADVKRPGMMEISYGTLEPPYESTCRLWVKLEPGKTDYACRLATERPPEGAFDPNRPCAMRLYFGASINTGATLSDVSLEPVLPIAINDTWRVFLGVKPPTSYGVLPEQLESLTGKAVAPQTVKPKDDAIDLGKLAEIFQEGNVAVLYNQFECQKSGLMRIGVAADWWLQVCVNGESVFDTLKHGNRVNTFTPNDHILDIPVKAGSNLIAVKVLSGSKGWLFVCGAPRPEQAPPPAGPTLVFEENSEWKAVDMSSLQVQEGSALDLSSLIEAPAGRHGRVIVNDKGSLAFENAPSQAVRMRGFNGVPRDVWQYHSEEAFEKRARLFAIAARRQGYRILRTNMIECSLTSGVDADMTFNPKYLRRWDYLLAQLKEQGIYVHFVIASYGVYYSPFSFENDVFKQRNEHKLRMFLGAESERMHWRFGAGYLLNHVNPYTGLAWKDDPAIATVEFYNEQELGVRRISQYMTTHPEIRALVENRWRAWLVATFNGTPTPELAAELNGVSLAEAPVPEMRGDLVQLANAFSMFITDMATESAAWCEKVVRDAGYPGLVTQYNFSKKLGFSAARWDVAQVVESNGYFSHPSNGQVGQSSSIEKAVDYWRGINTTRLAGRPFMVTEFNHAFWNAWQHECGLAFGAYSALQDYSSIMVHSSPVELEVSSRAIGDFTCGGSPVVRANEFLAGCLYQRGDVKKARGNLELRIPSQYLNENSNGDKPVNSEQSKLALMTGFSLAFPDRQKPQGVPDELSGTTIAIAPAGGGIVAEGEWATNIVDTVDSTFSLDNAVGQLKQAGVLPATNISDPAQGIYQSDTGEIIMRSNEKLLKVLTPKTEAISLDAGKSEPLKALRIQDSSVAATIAVCSMDDHTLSASSRIVLIYATEVANTGMKLSHDRKEMLDRGKLPILMKTGKLSATLINHNGADMSLYALNQDGARSEKLPLAFADGSLKIDLDTSLLKNGPTAFFELVVE